MEEAGGRFTGSIVLHRANSKSSATHRHSIQVSLNQFDTAATTWEHHVAVQNRTLRYFDCMLVDSG